jgi:regulation of enolase protein 1 (concanavalin A-like superfamily)
LYNPNNLRRLVALVVTLTFLAPLPFGPLATTKVSAAVYTEKTFDGLATTKTMDFTNQKVNDTLSIRLPKASKLTGASVDVQAVMVSKPATITLDQKPDFLGANPQDLNLNKTMGMAYINEKQNISDNFNDGVFDSTNWSWMNPPASVYENASTGRVEITSNTHTNWSGNTQTGSFAYKDVTGNFMAISKIYCAPDKNQESCGLMVYSDSNNWFQEVYKWRKYGNNGGTMLAYKQRQGGTTANDWHVGINSVPLWIKITRHADSWVVWYGNSNSQGVIYSEHTHFDWALPGTVRVGMIVYDGLEANLNFRADFDSMNISRYMDYGNMTVGPIVTQFPVTHVKMNQDLQQLEVWESFQVQVRANDTGNWQILLGDTDTLIDKPGTNFYMKVSIGGKGWTTPTLRSVTLQYFPESWPSFVTVDIGNDGTKEWYYNQTMIVKGTASNPEIWKALDDQKNLLTSDIEGYVHIPVRVVSQTPGKLTFLNLAVNLFTGHPPNTPVLGGPANNTWVGTRTPTFNFTGTDIDSDTLVYRIQMSQDNFNSIAMTFDMKTDLYGWTASLYDSGQEARFTVDLTKPLEQGQTYQWRVQSSDGGWWSNYSAVRTIKVDMTAPAGTVTDVAGPTPVNREATATVDFTDVESGIKYMECGLGNQKGKTNIVPMTPVDLATGKVNFKNLTLENKSAYYFTARARNNANLWSDNTSSKGFTIDLSMDAPPVVVVSNPANGTQVDGLISISGTASDANAQDPMTVYAAIDENPWSVALGNKIWSFDWDTKKVADGAHYISVKAFDGMRDSKTIIIRVIVGNSQLSFASWTPQGDVTINETQSIELKVALRDPAGIFKSYSWSIDGVNVPNLNSANFTYTTDYKSAGRHQIEIKALGSSMSATHVWNITVVNQNRDPKALITSPKNKDTVEKGKAVYFDATGSSDPDSDALTYLWDFGDKTTSTLSHIEHKYKKQGTYTVKLTVKDKYNATSEATITVKIVPQNLNIAGQLFSFPLVLIWVFLIVGITLGVVFYIGRKFKQQKDFEKKLDTKIDNSSVDDLLYYNPTQQAPQSGVGGMTPQQPPEQYPPQGGQTPPPQ